MASTLIFRVKDGSPVECIEVDSSFWLCKGSSQVTVTADLVIVDLEVNTVAVQVKYGTSFRPSLSLLRLIHASHAYATSMEGGAVTASFELKLQGSEVHHFQAPRPYAFVKARVDLAPVKDFADIVRSMEPAFNCRHYSGRLGVLKCEVNPGVACRECPQYKAVVEKTL